MLLRSILVFLCSISVPAAVIQTAFPSINAIRTESELAYCVVAGVCLVLGVAIPLLAVKIANRIARRNSSKN